MQCVANDVYVNVYVDLHVNENVHANVDVNANVGVTADANVYPPRERQTQLRQTPMNQTYGSSKSNNLPQSAALVSHSRLT